MTFKLLKKLFCLHLTYEQIPLAELTLGDVDKMSKFGRKKYRCLKCNTIIWRK